MCRSTVPSNWRLTVDQEAQKKIRKVNNSEYRERKSELQKEGKLLADLTEIMIEVGNTHEYVKDPKKTGEDAGEHKWTAFVRSPGDT